MARKRADARVPTQPYAGNNFLVDWGGGDPNSAEHGFFEVVFPDFLADSKRIVSSLNEREPVDGRPVVSQNLILRRGVTGSLDLYQWWNQTRRGKKVPTRTVTVALLAPDHNTVVFTWQFTKARPVRLAYSTLNALSTAVLIETLELEFDSMEMV